MVFKIHFVSRQKICIFNSMYHIRIIFGDVLNLAILANSHSTAKFKISLILFTNKLPILSDACRVSVNHPVQY